MMEGGEDDSEMGGFARSELESCAPVHCHGWSGLVNRIIHMTQYTSVDGEEHVYN